MTGAARPLPSSDDLVRTSGGRVPDALRAVRGWLAGHQTEAAVVAALLVAGGLLRPAAAAATPSPVAVAPQYGRTAVTVYFTESTHSYLLPITRRVEDGSDTPRHALEALVAGPEAGLDLRPVLAPGAAVAAFETHGDEAMVDLAAGSLDGVDAARAVDAILLSVTESGAVSKVRLSVAGTPVNADGKPGDGTPLTRPALNPETPAAEHDGMELYFVFTGQADEYLVPVTRAGATRDPGGAIHELLAGPAAGSGLTRSLPADVGLINWRREGALAVVNVNDHLLYAYRLSKANAQFVRRAVMATLTRLPGVNAGLIEISGSRMLMYSCINVTQEFPQARPWALNDEFYLTAST